MRHRGREISFIVLAVVGIVLSAISLYHYTAVTSGYNVAPVLCGAGAAFDCTRVNASPWSTVLGIPLAAWGLVFYTGILSLAAGSLIWNLPRRELLFDLLLLAGAFSAAYSIYLFIVSEFVIGSLCLVCAGMYAVNFTVLFLNVPGKQRALQRLRHGLRAVLHFPRLLLRGAPALRQAAWAFAAALAAAAVAALLVPRLYLLPRFERAQQDAALVAWHAAPVHDVPVRVGDLFGDLYRGNPDAPIRVIEFADFQCPACRRFYEQMETLLEEYGNDILFVFKNYPLDERCNPHIRFQYHRHACFAAQAALCGSEQGKYWQLVEALFQLPELEAQKPDEDVQAALRARVQALGLDQQALTECLAANRYKNRLLEHIRQAEALKIEGTPLVLVNGRIMKHHDRRTLKRIFDEILSPSRK